MTSGRSDNSHKSNEHGLFPFRRTVVAERSVAVSYDEVRKAVRVCLSDLLPQRVPPKGRPSFDLTATASIRRLRRWAQVPVDVEIATPHGARPGVVAQLHWRSHKLVWLFPVMDADLLVFPGSNGQTRLVFEGTYHPPFGALGLLGDLVIGRSVARSTAETFLAELGDTLEAAIRERWCAVGSSERTNEVEMLQAPNERVAVDEQMPREGGGNGSRR